MTIINIIKVNSEYPLGTTDGTSYTIVPRR